MTHFEKVTREEIERRNYTECTTRTYVRTIAVTVAGYFQRPPEHLTPEQIREYIAHLFRVRKLADNTVNQTRRSPALLLHQDPETVLERGGNALP